MLAREGGEIVRKNLLNRLIKRPNRIHELLMTKLSNRLINSVDSCLHIQILKNVSVNIKDIVK